MLNLTGNLYSFRVCYDLYNYRNQCSITKKDPMHAAAVARLRARALRELIRIRAIRVSGGMLQAQRRTPRAIPHPYRASTAWVAGSTMMRCVVHGTAAWSVLHCKLHNVLANSSGATRELEQRTPCDLSLNLKESANKDNVQEKLGM
jgi:hypothetical protein